MTDAEYRKAVASATDLRIRMESFCNADYERKLNQIHEVWHLDNGEEARGFLCPLVKHG